MKVYKSKEAFGGSSCNIVQILMVFAQWPFSL